MPKVWELSGTSPPPEQNSKITYLTDLQPYGFDPFRI